MIFRSLASLTIRVGGAATSFGFQILLARLLGPAALGVYHTANTLSQLAAVIGRRGLDSLLVKHASVAHGEDRPGDTRAITAGVLRVVAASTGALTLALVLVALLVGDRWLAHPDAVPTLVVFLLAALPLALVATLGEALKSVGRPLLSAPLQGLAVPALNVLAIAILGAVVATAAGASWVFLVSATLAAALGAWAWRAACRGPAPAAAPLDTGPLTVEARPYFVAAVASMVAGSADVLILSVFGRADEVGIYAVASRMAVLFTLVSVGVSGVVAPRFARSAASRDAANLRKLSLQACAMTAAAGLPILLLTLLAPAWLLGLFGPEFTAGALVLQLVVAGRYVSLVSGPLGHLLQMAGQARKERDLTIGAAAVLVALAFPLSSHFGATGTAAAACITWAGLGLARIVVAVRWLRSGSW